MRQEDVRRALGWGRQRLSRLEAGRSCVSTEALRVLLEHYGMTGTALADDLETLARRARANRWRR